MERAAVKNYGHSAEAHHSGLGAAGQPEYWAGEGVSWKGKMGGGGSTYAAHLHIHQYADVPNRAGRRGA